jgi:EAL and modified HD-GYP domain-containing signal transduction protein
VPVRGEGSRRFSTLTMTNSPILGQVALGYSPMIDRNRVVIATRLTVFPLRPDIKLDVGQLLEAVGEVWPASGPSASLNILSEGLLQDLLQAQPSTNLMVEVPSFIAVDEANVEVLKTLRANGSTLLLKGRPSRPLPREVLPCFKHSIIELEDDRRTAALGPEGVARNITHVQAGVRTLAEMEESFKRGAFAVLGWPMEDAIRQVTGGKPGVQPDMQVILELIKRVDDADDIERLENTLKRDPTLAFKLMRYINSPAFGLSVEISSFRHAIMMLGYNRLKRWLALLLVTAGKSADMKPVMFAAVRRGILMEELVRSAGDEEMRNEMFICGVFSLLDRMMRQPFSELLKSIPVPERVYQALAEGTGPYQPYFELMRAIEAESLFDVREAADRLMVGMAEINRAVLHALGAANQLE